MFRDYWLIVLDNDNDVDSFTRIAANHHLQCLYKIGVYGIERQHELYIVGTIWNYYHFLKEINPKKRK